MRVTLDPHTCGTTGVCTMIAPTVFRQREEDGVGEVIDPHPAPDLLEDVREAEISCPVAAIRLTTED
jgi:ferredoxin